MNEFRRVNCQMVVVSFGEAKGARQWLDENFVQSSNVQFDMITDERRALYKLFGVKKSYLKVWHTDTLTYYGEQVAIGRELPRAYQDIEDDPHQMGGNFIVKLASHETASAQSQFSAVYCYRSKNPPDRPSHSELLSSLVNISQINK